MIYFFKYQKFEEKNLIILYVFEISLKILKTVKQFLNKFFKLYQKLSKFMRKYQF